jgi:hypothetical protein
MDRSELLTDTRWCPGLTDVLLACPTATAEEEASLLRKAYTAISDAAALNPAFFAGLPPAGRFELLLASGAHESAAIALIPDHAGFMLSRGGNDRYISSVVVTGCGEHTIEGNTAALAIMAAMISAYHSLLQVPTPAGNWLN